MQLTYRLHYASCCRMSVHVPHMKLLNKKCLKPELVWTFPGVRIFRLS